MKTLSLRRSAHGNLLHVGYDHLVKCAGAFEKDGVRAVLWHQGKSDSPVKTSAVTYGDRLKTIIDSLDKDDCAWRKNGLTK